MSPGAIALAIIFAIVAIGSAVGFSAGVRRTMNMEQWTVAGRGFGVIFVWLLMAGEVYTAFAFLGTSGWAYSRGGPALYILAYISLAYVLSYYILPELWEVGRAHGLQTESDFFQHRYALKPLAPIVAVVGVVFVVPYLQLQLTGLGIIVEVASYGAVSRTAAMLIAGALAAGFVLTSGVRAVAWVSVLKDVLLLAAAAAIGIGVPYVYFGGIGPMFTALIAAHPTHLVMPGATPNLGHAWFVSTVLLSACGFYMWPHAFAATFTARSADTIRRNAVVMPLYSITLPFVFFAGFAALLVMPHLANGDLSLLTIARATFPAWFLGVIGGAGALTAMVPAAILVLTAAALFAKNFYRPLFAPAMTDAQLTRLAKAMVLVLMALALYFTIYGSTTLVGLLLLGYSGITQFFPGVVFGLYWPRTNAHGVLAGLLLGVATVAWLSFTHRDPLFGLNAGFVGLCANFAVVAGVTAVFPHRRAA